MKPRIAQDGTQPTHESKITHLKTKSKSSDTRLLRFPQQFEPRSSTFPFLPLALPGTRPLTCQGKSFEERKKKKPKSRKRFCRSTSLASSRGSKLRRKAETRTETPNCAQLYTSRVSRTPYGESTATFSGTFTLPSRFCAMSSIFFATFRQTRAREPSRGTWSDCRTRSLPSEKFSRRSGTSTEHSLARARGRFLRLSTSIYSVFLAAFGLSLSLSFSLTHSFPVSLSLSLYRKDI